MSKMVGAGKRPDHPERGFSQKTVETVRVRVTK